MRARIAGVGDRVDFVVTLGASANAYTGRLERQTSTGVVAIRQLDADTCSDVADALALTLALSSVPGAAVDTPPDATPRSELPVVVAPQPERNEPQPQPRIAPPTMSPRDDGRPLPPARRAQSAWSLGAQGLVFGGVAPTLLPAVGVFIERTFDGKGVLVPTFRLTGLGGRANGSTYAGTLDIQLVAARVEACPLQFGSDHLRLLSCLGMDVGVLQAELERSASPSASDIWASFLTHPRLAWSPHANLTIETQAGISVPITHREVVLANADGALYETAAVGLQAGVALAYRLAVIVSASS